MTELSCEIQEIITKGDTDYFKINSTTENQTYIIPTDQLLKYNVKVGESHFFEKKINKKSKKYFLEYLYKSKSLNFHSYYKQNECYEFEIVNIESSINKKGSKISVISLKDVDENIITVLGLKWQTSDLWKFKTLKCEVINIYNNGYLSLKNCDFRHPIYQVGKEYKFQIIDEKIKEVNDVEYNIYELLGEDGCKHELNRYEEQTATVGQLISCTIIKISTHLRLSQGNLKDKYFNTFQNIIKYKNLERKYFNPLFNDLGQKYKDVIQLIDQYNSQSAFWVFTYTNKILPKLFREEIQKNEFKKAKEINELIIVLEEWIISKGIISSIPDIEIRDNTVLKAKSQLESAKIIDSVISILIANQYYYLSDDDFFNDKKNLLARFYFIISFSNVELLDSNLVVHRLSEILRNVKLESRSDLQYLNKLLNYISYSKKIFISEKEKEYFSLSAQKIGHTSFTKKEIDYINWSYSEILISQLLNKRENANILIGQLLKLLTKSTNELSEKECLLYNSYKYFENFQNFEIVIPFAYESELSINYELLDDTLLKNQNDNVWDELENFQNNKKSFSVILTKKSKTGYEVSYNNLRGFLPYHLITDNKLKTFPFEDCSFTIDAKCLSISRNFDFFIIEQFSFDNLTDSYVNNILFTQGRTYDAIIKKVVGYGIFLSTNAGEGLLHVNDIFDFGWNKNNIYNYFKKGQNIKVVLTQITVDNKAQFNFYKIKEENLLYYDEYVERILFKNSIGMFETDLPKELDTAFETALNEKAFCIEQFAVLQLDITKKIQNFQIAKQFYTNAKNARSFLINIYIAYFEVLLNIKATIHSGTLNDITQIKRNAIEIKNKMDLRTIETFPDSDKLIFFLDIISIFNEKSDNTSVLLFDYIQKYSHDTSYKDLKTIAKITLANNLLISESKEDGDFSMKNLRMIFDYLSNGILSLEETIDDLNLKQLKEDVLYWSERIKEDEGETLEFKSSFFTPILDDMRMKRFEIINKIEKKTDQNRWELSKINGELAKKAIIHSSLKTLVAFANHKGGTLLIGVDDNKKIIGLEQEYITFSKKDQNRDGFGKYFDSMIKNYIGDSFSSLMNRKFLKFPEGDVLIVNIEPSNHEVFLLKNDEGKDEEQLYIRNLSSSKELKGAELAKYVRNKYFVNMVE
ncbi:putative DNA binding domain-containing protein [Flavobacterium tructae]|uniref:RNA-binding domain-containing protein n=1 Tax=Flavobacterium tructae TaxID=1114873 RepID=UPI002551F6CF|nr:RNA-binding domain-containing protein [Flavobacterium tructae]MDL2144828.1 putative DNA binding domain-containing protein [Flavobacterium tructae]